MTSEKHTRRAAMKAIGLATAGLALSRAVGAPAQTPQERPNVLWLYCEDLSPWLPAYGDTTVKTPHLDALAADGAVFTNCFAASPVCSPSRSAVITGCMASTLDLHQHRSNRSKTVGKPLPAGVKTLPELFRAAGYFTYNHGKDDFNFRYDHATLYSDGHKPKSYGFYGVHGYGDWTERKVGQPFFGQFMLLAGKHKGKIADPLDPAKVTVPPYYPDHPAYRAQIARHYDQIRMTDAEVGKIIARLKTDGLYDNTIIVFLSDHGGPLLRGKCLCYDQGLHVPLMIAWPGNPKAIKRGKRTDLCSLLDLPATMLALAGLPVPDHMESRPLFAPDYKRDYIIATRDRCDWCIDRIRAVRTTRYAYMRNYITDRPLVQKDYRQGKDYYKTLIQLHAEGKLTAQQAAVLKTPRPAEELYDLQADPHQVRNLAADPKHAKTLASMRRTLATWIKQTGDKGQQPESDQALRVILKRWGKRCVNPEFDRLR